MLRSKNKNNFPAKDCQRKKKILNSLANNAQKEAKNPVFFP